MSVAAYVAALPAEPRIPYCIGDRLEDWEIDSLTERYGTTQFTDHGKETYSYTNPTGTCELHFWGDALMAVQLLIPVDQSLGIPQELLAKDSDDDSRTWTVSMNQTRIHLGPTEQKWSKNRPAFPQSYTVVPPDKNDQRSTPQSYTVVPPDKNDQRSTNLDSLKSYSPLDHYNPTELQ